VSLRVHVSSSGPERLAEAERFVSALGPATELVVVAATREAADDFCRGLVTRRGASFGLHRFTLGQLASRAAGASLAARGLAVCSAFGAEAVAARAVFELAQAEGLDYLAPVADSPGFARAVASTIGEIREGGAAVAALDGLPDPGSDLARLAGAYARELDRARVVDRAGLVEEAARLVAARAPGSLAGLPILFLDVRIGSAAERGLVAAFAVLAPASLLTVAAGDDRTLLLLPAGATVEESDRPGGTSALERVRHGLFSETASAGPDGSEVVCFSAPGEGREAVEVARRILTEAARGVAFDDIAVVLRAPDSYWGPLEHALARAGVPAWYARGTRRPDPAGRAFLALVACAAEGLSARRFAEYLSLGQVPRRDARGAPVAAPPPVVAPADDTLASGQMSLLDLIERGRPAVAGTAAAAPTAEAGDDDDRGPRTPWKWERLLVESSVVGGAGRWRRRLTGLAEELAVRRDEALSDDPGSAQAAAIARDLDALDELRRFALPLVDALAALPASARWGEWLDRFESLAPMALRHPARVLELLAELRPMAGIGPVSLAEVRQVLVPRLTTLDRDPPKVRFGRVFVGTPDQLRGRAFRTVFVVGLAERLFPQRNRQDPLLLDDLRAEIDAPLAIGRDRVSGERLLLRLAVGAARERLFVSYPRLDVLQGRARVPSFYLLDVVRGVRGTLPDYESFERETAVATGAWLAWPAPADADTAIDECEHDLAVLGGLLSPDADRRAIKGAAHYLLVQNDALARSLRTRWARWSKRWSGYDGLVGQTEVVTAGLARSRLTARPYSVTALQRFAACPYQFLLGSIYRIEPLERPGPIEQLDPLTRGALFHEIQRDVLRARAAGKRLPVTADGRERAMEVVDAAWARVVSMYAERLAPAIDRVWQDETEIVHADLRMWIDQMIERDAEWVPRYFELSFGLPIDEAHDPASVREPVVLEGRFPIRGAIDVVEEHALLGFLRVTDHKTGRNRTTDRLVVGGGGTLQPVIYGLVAEQILGRTVKHARLSFATAAGGFTEHVVSLRPEARRPGIETLEIIDRAIEAGALPPAPREGACAWCDFAAICGPLEERRFARKTRDLPVIADLAELRRLP
jgi:CRISPR/Cas system-associated exonuclease Cas4 (RecB family)